MPTRDTRILGQQTEQFAQQYLQQQGLSFITKNYRTRFGEIDLIMQDKKELVFVEVRYRKHTRYVSSEESISYHKQQRLTRTAYIYLDRQKIPDNVDFRFDVLALHGSPQNPTINWIKAAF